MIYLDPHFHGIAYIIYISISLSMVIFIMKYEITDKGQRAQITDKNY